MVGRGGPAGAAASHRRRPQPLAGAGTIDLHGFSAVWLGPECCRERPRLQRGATAQWSALAARLWQLSPSQHPGWISLPGAAHHRGRVSAPGLAHHTGVAAAPGAGAGRAGALLELLTR